MTPAPPGASFDLRTEPWIPVTTAAGEAVLVGLEGLLRDAHTYRRLSAESPTVTAALHRLLVALLHRVHDGPASESAWAGLWRADRFPEDAAAAYFARFAGRFDLFDRDRPFLQCPDLGGVAPSTPAKLVPYRAVGNNVTLFDHTTAADRVELAPAQAARWLVALHAFDPGGMKTPFVKDKSSERAPCNDFAVVLVEGKTLKETLLLNLLVYRPGAETPVGTGDGDAPAWEDAEAPTGHPVLRERPKGWTDLLTWPSRRVLLRPTPDGAAVGGVVVSPGTRLLLDGPVEEKMAAFRKPVDAKGKVKREAPLLPVRLHPVRGVWRHSVELLLVDTWEEGRSRSRPAVLDQIAQLAEDDRLPKGTVYALRVFGQQLDSKASVVEAWAEEEVLAPVALLRARDENLGSLIGEAVAYADEAGAALRALQANFRSEKRGNPRTEKRPAPGASIDVAYWPRLARPFSDLLVALGAARDAGAPEDPAVDGWGETVARLARAAADRWIEGSPAEGATMLALGKHHGLFLSRLAQARSCYRDRTHAYVTVPETGHA